MRRWAVLLLAASGCASDPTSCKSEPDYTAHAPAQATAADVQPILTRHCALGGCHLHAPGAGGLVLDVSSTAWIDAVVGVRAQESTMDLVAPGDPSSSWLVRKVFGSFCGATCSSSAGCGGQMPIGPPLSDDERGTIVAWIAAGAS